MPKFFPAVSHAQVRTVSDANAMKAMRGTMAFVDIYFGPGENFIGYIAIKKIEGPTLGVQAHIPKTQVLVAGKPVYIPVIQGEPADELKMLALKAFDRVKQAHGLKFSKTYRVLAKTVEEVGGTNAVDLPRVGA